LFQAVSVFCFSFISECATGLRRYTLPPCGLWRHQPLAIDCSTTLALCDCICSTRWIAAAGCRVRQRCDSLCSLCILSRWWTSHTQVLLRGYCSLVIVL